ncbi:MAG: hypothetical protein JWL63_1087 [Rhodocyclales bacterium]|nr:hypothetical protein [Rhodocyclales bacterium]
MALNQKAPGGATTGHKENSRSHTGNQHNAAENGKLQSRVRSSESSSQNLAGRDMRATERAKEGARNAGTRQKKEG